MASDGARNGVVVLDPLPGQAGVLGGVVRPNVVLRYWTEEPGGGVAAAAPRELFAEHALRGQTVVLDYGAGRTAAGSPVRRHHGVVQLEGRPVHSLRWYVGAAQDVLELTLTFDEAWLPRQLWEAADAVVDAVRAPLAGAPAASGADLHDPRPETILTDARERLTSAESLVQGLAAMAAERPRWTECADADDLVRAVEQTMEPRLVAEGTLRGRRA